MRFPDRRLRRQATALVAVGALAAACSSSTPEQATTTVNVAITDAGCAPNPASAPAGPVVFKLTNAASATVNEVELFQGGKKLGEKENVGPGQSGDFTLRLEPGDYTVFCQGATKDTSAFTVTGSGGSTTKAPDISLTAATTAYHDYVVSEVDLLTAASKSFTDAVRAGDMAKAMALFAPARFHYESIEPVAESFGDLDPAIDIRIDDVTDQTKWYGFHRIEKALWVDKSLAGMSPIADQLDADIATLKSKVATETYQPAQLANGAGELLNEVSTFKVTGEEDRYSHTDLSDFEANIAGARKCFELLQPALAAKDPDLARQLEARFTAVTDQLGTYKKGDVYVDYSTVAEPERRTLADRVNSLAEPLSQVAGKVV